MVAKLWRNKSLDWWLVRLQNGTDLLGNGLAVASKIKCVWNNPATMVLDRYVKVLKTMSPQNLHGGIYNTNVHNCQNLEATNTTLSKWRIGKRTVVPTSNGGLALKMNRPVKTWKDIIESYTHFTKWKNQSVKATIVWVQVKDFLEKWQRQTWQRMLTEMRAHSTVALDMQSCVFIKTYSMYSSKGKPTRKLHFG